MPIANEGTPTNWTLSFKHAHITVLLFTEPLTPLSTLRADLLTTLRERYPSGLPSKRTASSETDLIPHPASAKDIVIGKRVNAHKEDEEPEWDEIIFKGLENPKSEELKDGSSLVFAYRESFEDNGFVVRRSTFYEDQAKEDAEAEAGEDDEMDEDGADL